MAVSPAVMCVEGGGRGGSGLVVRRPLGSSPQGPAGAAPGRLGGAWSQGSRVPSAAGEGFRDKRGCPLVAFRCDRLGEG